MLRRFSINFALFSMLLDGLSTAFSLWLSAAIRPAMNVFSFIKNTENAVVVPSLLFVLFPLLWVIIFASLTIYDGRKFLRAADELAALFLSTFIASISTAGILYFSYREVSRALFIIFVVSTFLLCLLWRVLARLYFRARRESSAISHRLLVVGMGPLGQSVGQQIQESLSEKLALVGFVDDGYGASNSTLSLGKLEELKILIRDHYATDVVIALPYSEY